MLPWELGKDAKYSARDYTEYEYCERENGLQSPWLDSDDADDADVMLDTLRINIVKPTGPRRIRGPSYPTLEAQTSSIVKATPPSGPSVGTIGHQPSPGKLRPLTKNLRIGTYLGTPYTSRPSVRPVPVRSIYDRRPSGTLCKWKQLNRSTAHQVTDTQSWTTRKCHKSNRTNLF